MPKLTNNIKAYGGVWMGDPAPELCCICEKPATKFAEVSLRVVLNDFVPLRCVHLAGLCDEHKVKDAGVEGLVTHSKFLYKKVTE